MNENKRAVIITNKTRLENLIARFNTREQSRYYIESNGGDFNDYEKEDKIFKLSLSIIKRKIAKHLKYNVLDRQYLPNYVFSQRDIVIVVGQDGLVANTAKYVNNIPIIAINPDPSRYDGILLPFLATDFETDLLRTIKGQASCKSVTMAEAKLNDGQRLLAFNDLYIGNATHVSSRYRINFQKKSENHSSSGLIVSTGAGSTGWLSSLLNMASGIDNMFRKKKKQKNPLSFKMEWEKQQLVFVVREPFLSKYSGIDLTAGIIPSGSKLILESYMPVNGVIFSDGIEADYMQFNSGTIAEIGVAEEKALIVQK